MSNVVVTGGSGKAGQAALRELIAHGRMSKATWAARFSEARKIVVSLSRQLDRCLLLPVLGNGALAFGRQDCFDAGEAFFPGEPE